GHFALLDVKWIALLLAGTADVMHLHVVDEPDLMPQSPQPQTKVGLLAVEKEARIETLERSVDFAPDDHACAENPGDPAWQFGEVLPHMALPRVAQGWPNFVPAIHGDNAVTRHTPCFVGLQRAAEPGEDVRFHKLRIRIEQINKAA